MKTSKSRHNWKSDAKKKPKKNHFTDSFRKKVMLFTEYYRENIHHFAEDYLGLKLFTFQKIVLYLMHHYSYFLWWSARGSGKSYLIAVYACLRSILYPRSKIIIASGTRSQASMIISQKIQKELLASSPILRKEIKEIKTSINRSLVVFWNGSTIEAVVSNANARGIRCNFLILDEFRLIDKETITKVLRPFLNVQRMPDYLKNPKYKGMIENNSEVYISSAWLKSHWSYETFLAFINSMCKGDDYITFGFPYHLSVHHGLLSEKRIEQIKAEADFDEISFQMEYLNIPFGEAEGAFYKLQDIVNSRTIPRAFYPLSADEYVLQKNKRKKSTKRKGEVRILSCDVALMSGRQNDNSVITLLRLLPNGKEYTIHVPFIESMNGIHSEIQALRLKELFEQFECDWLALDCNGVGMSIYDCLTRVQYSEKLDKEFEAWTTVDEDDFGMRSRTLGKNALPVIYPIKANSLQINHEIAVGLKDVLQRNKLKLLINDIEAREDLFSRKGVSKLTVQERSDYLLPFVQTSLLQNELVNLEYEIRSTFIRIKEASGARKDRFSSLAYGVYVAKLLQKNLKDDADINWDDYSMW